MKIAASLGGVCVAFCLNCSTAWADPAGWAFTRKNTKVDVKVSAGEDYTYKSLSVGTTDPSQPELRFSCSEPFGLKVTIFFQPRDDGIKAGGDRVRYKQRISLVSIEGREPVRASWTHIRETRMVQSRNQKIAKMLFNAVVTGKAFTVKEPLRTEVSIAPPPVDDAFTQFAQECHITNGGKQ